MKFRDLWFEIWNALSANKGRSALTILGIVIGIAAVVTMTSLIAGMRSSLLTTVGANQARLIQVASINGNVITRDDLNYIKEHVSGVSYTGTMVSGEQVHVSTDRNTQRGLIYATSPRVLKINEKTYKLNKGRYFLPSDSDQLRQVAILDGNLVKQLFNDENADVIGKTVSLNGHKYSIIGTLKPASGFMAFSGPGVYVPLKTAVSRLGTEDKYDVFYAYVDESQDINTAKNMIKDTLDKRHPVKDSGPSQMNEVVISTDQAQKSNFQVMTSEDITQMVDSITSVFTAILGSVASISLIVGGIGIMNMMLTNVSERIKEIGLRKSIGAKSRDITNQFLGESIVLCLIGGVIGLILGYLAALGIAAVLSLFSPDMSFTPVVTPQIAAIAFIVSSFIGIAFGYGPARKAAKLDPVESLRHQ